MIINLTILHIPKMSGNSLPERQKKMNAFTAYLAGVNCKCYVSRSVGVESEMWSFFSHLQRARCKASINGTQFKVSYEILYVALRSWNSEHPFETPSISTGIQPGIPRLRVKNVPYCTNEANVQLHILIVLAECIMIHACLHSYKEQRHTNVQLQ